MSYNDSGIRTRKTVNGTVTDYFLDGSKIVAEKTGNNTTWYYYDGDGTREAIEYNGNVYYYFYNAQGDVMGLYDNNLNVVVNYTYDSWGNTVSITGSLASTLGQDNPFRYRGYYFDSDTGLYYLNSRYYDANTGRFINADNIVTTGNDLNGTNLFTYCNNNPVNATDSSGHAWYHWAIGAGIVAGLAFATVLTAGSFAFAITAFGFAASGISVGGLTGGLAMATIGSAYALGASAMVAAFNSNSVSDFNSQGNWGTVGATTFGGITGFASGYSKPLQTKSIPNPNGKKGGAAHQAEIQRQMGINNKPGFTVAAEVKINTPGGMKPYRYADFSVTNDVTKEVWYGNVGRQLQSGQPCARERYAISDIRGAGKIINFYPYN